MIKKCFIDVETSGLDPELNAILEIGGIIEYSGVYKEFSLKCRPFEKDEITVAALEVNRLTMDNIVNFPDPKDTYLKFTELLAQHVDRYNNRDKFFFIGYNANFDNQFLRSFFKKNESNYFGSWFFYPYIDVMTLAAYYLMKERHKMKSFHLVTVAPYFGIDVDLEKAHGALYDVKLTRDVYNAIEGGKIIEEDLI